MPNTKPIPTERDPVRAALADEIKRVLESWFGEAIEHMEEPARIRKFLLEPLVKGALNALLPGKLCPNGLEHGNCLHPNCVSSCPGRLALPPTLNSGALEAAPEWLWYGEVDGKPVVTFGRWPKGGAKWRYKFAEIQPTEHDHSGRSGHEVS